MKDIVLNKTADGRYWTLDGWVAEDTALRLRVTHATYCDPSEVQAEVGVWNTDDQTTAWTPVKGPFAFALATPDDEAEEDWTRDFPEVWHAEFVELGRILARISRHLDLGPALGTWPQPTKAGPA